MAEFARTPSISETADSISDVLASIRRLIAQDEENRLADAAPDDPVDLRDTPVVTSDPQESPAAALQRQLSSPLVLRPAEMRFPDAAQSMQPANLAAPVAEAAAATDLAIEDQAQGDDAVPPLVARDSEDSALHLFAMDEPELATEKLIRALIRETVLQELQGELGSRVSRNIRDLVRAEISRALDAQLPV